MRSDYILPRLLLICFAIFYIGNLFAQQPIFETKSIHHPVMGEKGMVASQHEIATQVGLDILKKGGNAIDAAVGVGFALAVVLPRAGNLGGGGFMLIYDALRDTTIALNYREKAPIASTKDMYIGDDGNVDNQLFNQSPKSIGVPGTVAGLIAAHNQFGHLPLKMVMEPAILLARNGFKVSYEWFRLINAYKERLSAWDSSKAIFFKSDMESYEPGDIWRQEDLAKTLERILESNGRDFYEGETAQLMVDHLEAIGGIITEEDLKGYQADWMAPLKGTYRGYEVVSMPPPSSGGIHLIQMLNILEGFPMGFFGHQTAATIHLMVETMKYAYADRSKHLGDPNYWNNPIKGLMSKRYADSLRVKINLDIPTPSSQIMPGQPLDFEHEETTHFSIIDSIGNMVSNTYTLNFSFGSGIVARGTGVLLNNEMGDFSAKPGFSDAYGLIGGEANAIEAGKRPLSSMTPTFLFKDGKPFLVTGSPGGSRIITTILQIILNVIDHDMNIDDATHTSRIHHQWKPDVLFHEHLLNGDTRTLLEQRGYLLQERAAIGSTQSILIKNGFLYGSSDPRRKLAMTLGY